jgi:hypothetical protein
VQFMNPVCSCKYYCPCHPDQTQPLVFITVHHIQNVFLLLLLLLLLLLFQFLEKLEGTLYVCLSVGCSVIISVYRLCSIRWKNGWWSNQGTDLAFAWRNWDKATNRKKTVRMMTWDVNRALPKYRPRAFITAVSTCCTSCS